MRATAQQLQARDLAHEHVLENLVGELAQVDDLNRDGVALLNRLGTCEIVAAAEHLTGIAAAQYITHPVREVRQLLAGHLQVGTSWSGQLLNLYWRAHFL